MAEINQDKLVRLVKSGKSHAECARELGITPGQLNMLAFGKAMVSAGKLSKAPNTEASIKKLRGQGLRFEYISAATGASVAKIKEIVGEGTYVGRGTKNGAAKKSGGRSSAKSSTARRSGVKVVAKKGAAKKTTARKTGSARAKTRAERAAKSGNPS